MADATHVSQSKCSFILKKKWFLDFIDLHTKANLDDHQQDIKMSPSNDLKAKKCFYAPD